MTDPLRAIILGVVEGITEFLPISSTGHMRLVEPCLGIPNGDPFWSGAFDIFIQIGAILAVVVYFWRRLYNMVVTQTRADVVADGSATASTDGSLGPVPWHEHILVKLFVAFLPAAFVGLAASKFIDRHLKTPPVIAGALIVGGIAILIIERTARNPRYPDAGRISLRVAFWIGVAQCLSLVPGTSRSAATIMGALVLGLTHAAAAEFSFFLAIPTMFAAGGYSLLKHLNEIHSHELTLLGLGFSTAFVVALLVIAAFMRFIQSHRFTPFAIYRIGIGILVLVAIKNGFFAS